MSTTHTCVYFEDGSPDHVCACGDRAVLLLDDDGEGVLVALDGEPSTVARSAERMPISA